LNIHAALLDTGVFLPWGRALLLGSLGVLLLRVARGTEETYVVFERVIIGFIALSFFTSAVGVLNGLSAELSALVLRLRGSEDLRAFILDAFQRAAHEPGTSGGTTFNIPSILEQAWRTGVWGVLSVIVEWVYLLSSLLLEAARDVLWQLLWVLFPIAGGIYPLFPRILTNLAIHSVELALWFPLLDLVEIATSKVARGYMVKPGSLGLWVVAVELIAAGMILLIPSLTHRFVSGALSGDFDAQASFMRYAQRAVFLTKSWGG
jgi:hypothetical protein